jgi:hypothetical protein
VQRTDRIRAALDFLAAHPHSAWRVYQLAFDPIEIWRRSPGLVARVLGAAGAMLNRSFLAVMGGELPPARS